MVLETVEGPLGLGIRWGLKWRSSSISVLIREWGESGATDWWMNWSDGDAAPVCGKERSKHEGRQIYWLIYIPVLWPWAVGSDSSFLLIADTINRNEVPQKGVWVRSLSSTCWGGSGIWPGCLLDASWARWLGHGPATWTWVRARNLRITGSKQ